MTYQESSYVPPEPFDHEPAPAAPEFDDATEALPMSAKDLLLSFYHSQGNPTCQHHLVTLYRFLHPDLRMSDEQAGALFQACQPAARAIVAHHGQHKDGFPPEKVDAELGLIINDLQSVLNNPAPVSGSVGRLVGVIARDVVNSDLCFIVGRAKGRDRSEPAPNARYTPRADAYLSHLCYYALEGHPTGSPFYDDVFARVHDYVLNLPPDYPLQLSIHAVEAAYTQLSRANH